VSGILFAAAGLLLLVSAFISAAESVVFAVRTSRLRTLLEEGFRRADRLHAAHERASEIHSSVFFLNAAFNLTAAGLIVGESTQRWGTPGLVISVPLATIGVLFASEGVPRLLASVQPIRVALLSAPLLLAIERWTSPVLAPFLLLDNLIHRRNGEEENSSEERELREMAELGRREGVVEEDEHELVERAFRMDELTAWDVMVPRVDIFAWNNSLTLEEIIPRLKSVPYSRVPVYGESIDDITGILYVREAYEAYVGGRGSLKLSELAREAFFIPGSLSLPRLLGDFQLRRLHMGIVADEFGGTDGLVTLEDVIEELVGEIEDERDIAEESLQRVSRNVMEAQGTVELREVNYAFNVSLPYLEYRSLNGFILEEMGRVPEAGDRLELPGLEIEILEATDTQVLRVKLHKTQNTPVTET
jgi:putative hemolysin